MKYRMRTSVIFGLLAALLIGCAPAVRTEVTTVSAMDEMIRHNIPARASQAQVLAFLDRQHIEHSEHNPDNRMISSIVRDTTGDGVVKGSILINFYFDRNARLKNYSVEEVFTGV